MEPFYSQKPFLVEAETYTNEYFTLADDLYFFRRNQTIEDEKEEIDAFGNIWGLAIGDLAPRQVQVLRGKECIPVVGPKLIWIPPHAIVHWRLRPGPLKWYSYLSSGPVPLGLPLDPVMFTGEEFFWPKSADEISQLFSRAVDVVTLTPAVRNPWAMRLKRRLDSEFSENLKIEEYAKSLGVAHETLTRAFHEEFGLPPVQYRNKIRLIQAMVEILMTGRPILEISQAVGFRDRSHFHQLFRRMIRSKPSGFRG